MSDPNIPGGNWQEVPPPSGSEPNQTPQPPPPAPQGLYPPNEAQTRQPPPYAQPQPPYPPAATGMDPTTAATVAYITFIPAVIFLFIDPYRRDPFVRFHSYQSIALFVAWVAVRIVLTFCAVALHMWAVTLAISGLVGLAFFVVWIICMVKAKGGQWFKLPLIGDFALAQSQRP